MKHKTAATEQYHWQEVIYKLHGHHTVWEGVSQNKNKLREKARRGVQGK